MSLEKKNAQYEHNSAPTEKNELLEGSKNNFQQKINHLSIRDASTLQAFIMQSPKEVRTKESQIIEERVPSYQEVAEQIAICAGLENIALEDLQITEAVYTPDQHLLVLTAVSKGNDSGTYKEFSYKIKQARPDGKPNPTATTSIDVTEWEDDMPIGGELIAEIKNGQWVILK